MSVSKAGHILNHLVTKTPKSRHHGETVTVYMELCAPVLFLPLSPLLSEGKLQIG